MVALVVTMAGEMVLVLVGAGVVAVTVVAILTLRDCGRERR